jgi:hypothetical protein
MSIDLTSADLKRSTPCWTAHDLMVDSLPGLVADLLSMTTGAAMLLRRSQTIAAAAAAEHAAPNGSGATPIH